ncbi:hypothetical protein [Bacillus sp. FJAT-28004]|uniref:hypothetical protein n=1 Tax=Bacillus sp. FJAT-28004 TaxID=1679165 RepID=UPI0006B5F12F|nr:hypothetical protein [Bacillus sp. FJAT-28004]
MPADKKERKTIVCDGFNLTWKSEQLDDLLRLRSEDYSIQQMAKYFRRPRKENLVALSDILQETELAAMLGDWWGERYITSRRNLSVRTNMVGRF